MKYYALKDGLEMKKEIKNEFLFLDNVLEEEENVEKEYNNIWYNSLEDALTTRFNSNKPIPRDGLFTVYSYFSLSKDDKVNVLNECGISECHVNRELYIEKYIQIKKIELNINNDGRVEFKKNEILKLDYLCDSWIMFLFDECNLNLVRDVFKDKELTIRKSLNEKFLCKIFDLNIRDYISISKLSMENKILLEGVLIINSNKENEGLFNKGQEKINFSEFNEVINISQKVKNTSKESIFIKKGLRVIFENEEDIEIVKCCHNALDRAIKEESESPLHYDYITESYMECFKKYCEKIGIEVLYSDKHEIYIPNCTIDYCVKICKLISPEKNVEKVKKIKSKDDMELCII